ncbi:MAG TPA: hypothetical protein VHA56_14590 [Mucilaginibacter sp.]|nr:hypothetical protein [Mucilaginibacter sp.]
MIKNTDLKVHGEGNFSIRDFDGDIDIGAHKWDHLFSVFNKIFGDVYFYGVRRWAAEKELEQTLSYLIKDKLIDEGKSHFNILFKIKEGFIYDSRKLVSTLWRYYEYPSFIFLADKENQSVLVDLYTKNVFFENILTQLNDALIIYRHVELDVLWFKTNINNPAVHSLFGVLSERL